MASEIEAAYVERVAAKLRDYDQCNDDDIDEAAKLLELLRDRLAADREIGDRLPRCRFCGTLATCHGTYEGDTGFACDACCGHGCEDGRCESISELCNSHLSRLATDRAERDRDKSIRESVMDMVDICLSDDADEQERDMAASTILEAVRPSMLAELANRSDRAEREERARPISWDWCQSNCDEVVQIDGVGCTWRLPGDKGYDVRLVVWDDLSGGIWTRRDGGDDWDGMPLTWRFTTAVQLLDLLRILKGGGE